MISVAFQMSEDYMCLLVCVIMPIMNLVSKLCFNYDGSEGGSFQPLFFFLMQLTENFPILKSRVKKQRLTCSFSTCWRSVY